MKSLFVIALIIKTVYSTHLRPIEHENFIFIKCILYLFISTIHSTIINFTIPIGAIVMFAISFLNHYNKKFKLKLIGIGLIIVLCSTLNFSSFTSPLQKIYLYFCTYNIEQIDVFHNTPGNNEYLFTLTNENEINKVLTCLRNSKPYVSWGNKIIPNDLGYSLKLFSCNHTTNILINSYSMKNANLFINNNYICYSNDNILPLIQKIYSKTPSVLSIVSKKKDFINISNKNILDVLYKTLEYSPKNNYLADPSRFPIKSYLFFNRGLGYKISFSSDFNYATLYDKGILSLPSSLSLSLKQQFILSDLTPVKFFDKFSFTQGQNISSQEFKYFISQNSNKMDYGLYKKNLKKNETILLHTVSSQKASYFILNNPYILILDRKSSSKCFLMLINQNLLGTERYLEKNKNILPNSLTFSPNHQTFSYIINNYTHSTLHTVSNNYHSSKVIATGKIYSSLFLSNNHLVFTQSKANVNYLYIYDITNQKVIQSIPILGEIKLVKLDQNKLYFAIQQTQGNILKQGLFYIDSNLDIFSMQ